MLCNQQYPNRSSFPISAQHSQVHLCSPASRFKVTSLHLTQGIYGKADHAVKQLSADFIPNESNMLKYISPKLEERTNTLLVSMKTTKNNTWHRIQEQMYIQKSIADLNPTWDLGQRNLRNPICGSPYSQGDNSNLLSLSKVLVQCSGLDRKHSVDWDVRTALNETKSRTILCLSFNNTDGRSEAASGKQPMILHEGKKMPEFTQPPTACWLWMVQPGIFKHASVFSD